MRRAVEVNNGEEAKREWGVGSGEWEAERQRDRSNFFPCLFISLSLCLSVSSSPTPHSPLPTPHALFAFAQRRPILRPAARDYLAGKFILITRDERPQSLQQPRMLARVADHDLITPPSRVMTDADALIEWAKGVDYAEADGVIVSLDAIAGGPPQRGRLDFVKWIRALRPSIAIYAFAAAPTERSVQSALNLVADSTLDFLLISGDGASRLSLPDEIAARKLSGKVAVEPNAEAATMLLLSRMLNRRFGFSPKIFPVFSSVEAQPAPLRQSVGATIKAAGGVESDSRGADALLFVHAPRTTDAKRDAFVEAIARSVENGVVKIAVLDLSETKEGKEALIAGLRRLKLFDKLIAYASSDPGSRAGAQADAIIRAVTHASRSEEHTSELQSLRHLVCRLLLE